MVVVADARANIKQPGLVVVGCVDVEPHALVVVGRVDVDTSGLVGPAGDRLGSHRCRIV